MTKEVDPPVLQEFFLHSFCDDMLPLFLRSLNILRALTAYVVWKQNFRIEFSRNVFFAFLKTAHEKER
jgi:hypothetical protein